MFMLGLSGGELVVVAFVVFAVLSAHWWPRLGELCGEALASRATPPAKEPNPPRSSDRPGRLE
jgi:hypothetical protein